jgi:hypothetical protein
MTRRHAISILTGAASAFVAAALFASDTAPQNFTAKLVNVAGAPDSIRIEILRWSTDEERERLLSAWALKSAPNNAGRGAGKGAAKAGIDSGSGTCKFASGSGHRGLPVVF